MDASDSLRIVHVLRSPTGGVFRHILDLAGAQASAGHQVGIVSDSLTGGAMEEARIAALAPRLALGSVRLPIARNIAPSDVAALAKVRATLVPLKPDVIHAHGAKGGVFGRAVAAWLGRSRPIARFYAPHGGSLHYDPASREGRLYFTVERALERVTDALIHASEHERRAYVEKVGAPQCPAVVVRNGLTRPEFEPVPPAPGAADLLYLGMLRDLKGVDVFLEALARLAASGRRVSAVVVGDGPDEARYREFVATSGLSELVTFRPPMPAREAFALGRTIVVPSRAESLPYVVLEAIAAGLPIVASRVGGVPEIFGPFSDRLFAPGNPVALVESIAASLDDPPGETDRAAALREHIGGEFSLEEMSSKIESVYRDGIEKRRKRR